MKRLLDFRLYQRAYGKKDIPGFEAALKFSPVCQPKGYLIEYSSWHSRSWGFSWYLEIKSIWLVNSRRNQVEVKVIFYWDEWKEMGILQKFNLIYFHAQRVKFYLHYEFQLGVKFEINFSSAIAELTSVKPFRFTKYSLRISSVKYQ